MSYLLNRTQTAFTMSAENLLKTYGKLYFWTFTFIDTPISDEYANEDWALFHYRLRKVFPRLRGLRVTELHRSHGIHYHALVNMRIPIERVKRLARGSGRLTGDNRYLDFGRMSVTKCDLNTAHYLIKYFNKTYAKSYQLYSGRRWGTIGLKRGEAWYVQCRDVVYETDCLRNRREVFGDHQIPFGTLMLMQHYTNLWGHWNEWPQEHRALVLRQGDTWIKHRCEINNEPF